MLPLHKAVCYQHKKKERLMAETEKCHVGTAIIMRFPLNKIILEIITRNDGRTQ